MTVDEAVKAVQEVFGINPEEELGDASHRLGLGRKIQAIKVVREMTDLGLHDAVQVIDLVPWHRWLEISWSLNCPELRSRWMSWERNLL